MTNVFEFKKKPETEPCATGPAKCIDCKHEWTAVIPTSVLLVSPWLECPSCSLPKGRLAYPFMVGDEQWECQCGNDLFRINEEGIYCPNCSNRQYFP